MKLDQKTRELDSRQDHIMTLIDQVSKTVSFIAITVLFNYNRNHKTSTKLKP